MSSLHDHVDYQNIPTNARGQPLRRRPPSRRNRLSLALWAVILVIALVLGMLHFRQQAQESVAANQDVDTQIAPSNADQEESQPKWVDDGVHPQVAWIMSFGGSVSDEQDDTVIFRCTSKAPSLTCSLAH